mgnify:CR=1 FL=1
MIQFKQSPVIFDEDSHSYQLDGKRLLGITGLIHSVLGLGVYPEADAYVRVFNLLNFSAGCVIELGTVHAESRSFFGPFAP